MKFIRLLAVLLFSCGLFAESKIISGDLNKVCEKALFDLGNNNFKTVSTVFSQGKFISAVSTYGLEKDSNMLVFLDNNTGKSLFSLYMEDYRASDIKIEDNAAWIVANKLHAKDSRLYKVDFEKTQVMGIEHFPTHNETTELGKFDKAYGIDSDENFVYIAHGGLGLVSFSKEHLKPVKLRALGLNPNTSHRSYITDILVYEDKILMGADNITYDFNNKTRAFEGYAVLNRADQKLLKKIPINQKREALFEPKLFLSGSDIVMKTMHLHFVNKAKDLLAADMFTPQKRIYRYTRGKPIGESFTVDGKILGCFKDDKNMPPRTFASSHKY
jgi:hypothetical protein